MLIRGSKSDCWPNNEVKKSNGDLIRWSFYVAVRFRAIFRLELQAIRWSSHLFTFLTSSESFIYLHRCRCFGSKQLHYSPSERNSERSERHEDACAYHHASQQVHRRRNLSATHRRAYIPSGEKVSAYSLPGV